MKRSKWLIFIIVTCVGLGAGLWLSVGVRAGFPLGLVRLSGASDVCDTEPQAAGNADGSWLAAVWVRGKLVNQSCVYRNQAVLSWATESGDLSAWHEPVVLPLPGGACAVHADVGLVGTTAHVVATYWSPCDASNADSAIRYYQCNLLAGTCATMGDAVYQAGIFDKRLSEVKVALDGQNLPHVVYAAGQHSLAQGDIYYTRLTSAGWSAPVKASTGDKVDGFYRPAIALSDGRVHIVWERHRNTTAGRMRGDVQYRYCEVATGICKPAQPISYLYRDDLLAETTYPLPEIAARDGRVLIVWNVCSDMNTNPPCEKFKLLYARSNNNGLTLSQAREVATDYPVSQILFSPLVYPGSDSTAGLVSSYATHTRPVVKLDPQLLPHIAWQVETPGGYVITTTRATTGTTDSFTWISAASAWGSGSPNDTSLMPALVLVDPLRETLGMHMIHMRAWQELVNYNVRSRSQIYYDYLGMRRYTLEAQAPLTGLYALPAGRMVQINARVRDLSGNPIANAPVMFDTDHGSFTYEGYGGHQMGQFSDSEGWVHAPLYTNLTGTAAVHVWLDTTPDADWDTAEPGVAYTYTWTADIAPAVLTLETEVLQGDLMTATLVDHLYESPAFTGYAMDYLLWWCPVGAAEPVIEPGAGPVQMDITTWSRQNLAVQAPLSAYGTYYLESREDDGADPCTVEPPVARSADITVLAAPPLGNPWLVLSNNQPLPGAPIDVTLKEHAADTYVLWWCPALESSAPVSQIVASGVVVEAGLDKLVSIKVPVKSVGLYRLESHTPGGACGDSQTRQAVSSLLQPRSALFLPFVNRNFLSPRLSD